jgi:hypothetical protein
MKIIELPEDKPGFFVYLTKTEALELIHSLAEQIIHKNPNLGRAESYDRKGRYFSIAVDDDMESR